MSVIVANTGVAVVPELSLTFPPHYASELQTKTSLGAERAILEILRGNEPLCSNPDLVTPRLADLFGDLLEVENDISVSPHLDFFSIICEFSHRPNQVLTIETLLGKDFGDDDWARPNIVHSIRSLTVSSANQMKRPADVLAVLCSATQGSHALAATRLLRHGFSIEHLSSVCIYLFLEIFGPQQDDESEPVFDGRVFAEVNMEVRCLERYMEIFSVQLHTLAVNTGLFDKPELWELMIGFERVVRSACNYGDQENLDQLVYCSTLAIARVFRAIKDAGALDGVLEERRVQVDQLVAVVRRLALGNIRDISTGTREAVMLILHLLSADEPGVGQQQSANLPVSASVSSMDSNPSMAVIERSRNNSNLPSQISPGLSGATVRMPHMQPGENPTLGGVDTLHGVGFSSPPSPRRSHKAMRQRLTWLGASPSRGSSPPPDPRQRLRSFTMALSRNRAIQDAVRARRFEFVETLENADKATEALPGQHGITITWPDLLTRMQKYVTTHLHAKEQQTCIRILDTLRTHLVAVRCVSGELLEFCDLPLAVQQKFVEKQNLLNSSGITTLVARIMSTHFSTEDDDLPAAAFRLAMELLNGGNAAVQRSIFDFVNGQSKGFLFGHLRARLRAACNHVRSRKEECEIQYIAPSASARRKAEYAISTFEFIRLLCEGHSLMMQHLIREQPTCQRTVNLLQETSHLLGLQIGGSLDCRRMDEVAMECVSAALALLIEALQGPCSENQQWLVGDWQAMEVCKSILSSPFSHRVKESHVLALKGLVIKLFASCMEGRGDKVTHTKLAELLEVPLLLNFAVELDKGMASPRIEQQALEICVDLFSDLKQLQSIDEFRNKCADHGLTSFRNDRISYVEVFWNGRCELVMFPLPTAYVSLSDKTKSKFLQHAVLSTADSRMKALISARDNLAAEMSHLHHLEKSSGLYRAVKSRLALGEFRFELHSLLLPTTH